MDSAGNLLQELRLDEGYFVYDTVADNSGGLWSSLYTMDGTPGKLIHVDKDGDIDFTLEQEDADLDLDSINGLKLLEDGTLMILTDSGLYFLEEGSVIAHAGSGTGNLVTGTDGTLYFADRSGNDGLYLIDQEAHSLGDAVLGLQGAQCVYTGGENYDFLADTGEKLLGLNLDGTVTEIADWSDIDAAYISRFAAELSSNDFLVLRWDALSREYHFLQVSLVDSGELPERETLYLAVLENSNQLQALDSLILHYNMNQDTYEVQKVTYPDLEALQLAITSGEQIDILSCGMDTAFYEQCLRQGLLLNLYDYMGTDQTVTKDELLPVYRSLMENTDGGLYRVSNEFRLVTVLGKSQYVGNAADYTMESLRQAAENMPEGMVVFQEGWYSALDDFLPLGRFVDFQNNTCNFTCEDFYEILSFIRDFFPEEYDYSQDMSEEPLAEDAVLLEYYFNFAVEEFVQGLASYPEEVYETVGVPDKGSEIVVDYAYSIMSTSAYPQAAWDFLATMFEDSVQEYTTLGFPVRTSVFDEQVQEAVSNGSVTQADVDRFMDVLNEKTYLYLRDDDLMDIIYEEAVACFAGDKTSEETAEIIQNRVMIYLSERE
jgi:hypothetical protein